MNDICKSSSDTNVSPARNDNSELCSSLKLLSVRRNPDAKRLSSPNILFPGPIVVEVPISQGSFSRASDVDGRSSYIRRLSKSHVDPLEQLQFDNKLSSGYVNEGFVPDNEKGSQSCECKDNGRFPAFTPARFSFHDDESEYKTNGLFSKDDLITRTLRQPKQLLRRSSYWWKLACFFIYNFYLFLAICKTWNKAECYCDGVKFLTVLTSFVYLVALYCYLLHAYVTKPVIRCTKNMTNYVAEKMPILQKVRLFVFFGVLVLLYIIYNARNDWMKLVPIAGILGFVALAYLMSSNRSKISWSPVVKGLLLQFVLATFVIRIEVGRNFFDCLSAKVIRFVNFTDAGSEFVFGYLTSGKIQMTDVQTVSPVLVFKVFPVIIFFSFCTSILYYYGIMQIVVEKFGQVLGTLVGTSPPESVSASSNIFLGMTEAPLLVKPYLPVLTKSELFTVMSAGFATIAGSILAAYVTFGINPNYLLSASVMAAPGALGLSKLFYPEAEDSETTNRDFKNVKKQHNNALEAAANGAIDGLKIIACITANLIGFIAFIRFLDEILSWLGSLVELDYISFAWLLSKAFIPFALMMGVSWDESDKVAELIGLKTVVNEFVAYKKLTDFKSNNELSAKAQAIATFALCGFSNLASIGIQVGALGAMIPSRRSELAQMGFKAMIAGSFVSFINACVAGTLYEGDGSLL